MPIAMNMLVDSQMHTRTHAHMHMHTHTHTRTRTHTHTRTLGACNIQMKQAAA